jgi:hypothetical protein
MKKIFIVFCLVVTASVVFAQNFPNESMITPNKEKSEKEEITSNVEKSESRAKRERIEKIFFAEKGNFALGADLVPILRTLGTVFWGEKNNLGFQGTPYFNGFPYPTVSIMSKYMVSNNCAIRANLGALIVSSTIIDSIPDDKAMINNAESTAKVADKTTTNAYGVSISLGAEYRLGNKRVVGIFGGDLLIGYYESSINTRFGNEMTKENPIPTTADYYYFHTSISDNSRALTQKNGGAFSAGIQLTTGVEVFVAPKIALGGQINISYIFTYNQQSIITAEGFNEPSGTVKEVNVSQSPKGWNHNFSTNNVGASLYLMFYF